ncbi:MAG: PorT family protein [Sphingomonadales bacterium]|nr:PorT family protein [Sphingomonadales bacterium]
MKKIGFFLFVVVCSLILGQMAFAQKPPIFQLGPRIGVASESLFDAASTPNPLGAIKSDPTLSYHGGLYMRLQSRRLSLQPELLFSSAASSLQVVNYPGGAAKVLNLDVRRVSVPVVVGIRFFKILRMQVGPSFNNLAQLKLRDAVNATSFEHNFRKSEISGMAGIGLDLGNLVLDVRYQSPLTNFAPEFTIGGQKFPTDGTPGTWMLTAGFKLF